ncbi:LOW QUALITY PROTEIN: leucine-rich repeat and IQ domain-containing protein 3 [Polymixia lowei]
MDNFITKIDALMECAHLLKLDLRGNRVFITDKGYIYLTSHYIVFQITQLPGALFWERLRQLQLLNLHDNNMETMWNIQGLAGCLKLSGLTLYDTPSSLMGNYRLCIVNCICDLG